MFRFTIRELLILTVTAGLAVGWWVEHTGKTGEARYWKERTAEYSRLLEEHAPNWRVPKVSTGPRFPYKPWGGIQPASSP